MPCKMADFNRDGFDDLVINYGHPGSLNAIQIINAKNVNAFAKGWWREVKTNNTVRFSPDAMTVGDFNGDGRLEIVGLTSQVIGQPASTDGNGLRLVVHTVDEKTLQISDGDLFPLTLTPDGSAPDASAMVPFTSAAAGKFTSTTHDQLLIAYAINGGTAKVELIDFAPGTFQPHRAIELGHGRRAEERS